MSSSGFDRRPTIMLHRVVSLLAFLLILYAALFSWRSWSEEKAEKLRGLMNLIELEEKAIDRYFEHLENSLGVLSRSLTATEDGVDLDRAFQLVKLFKSLHPEFTNITFIREDGQILFTAKNPPGQDFPTLAGEPSFEKFLEEPREERPFDIGRPLQGLISKEWIIPFRHQVRSRDGRLAYVVSANLPIGILSDFWKDAPFTRTAALGLMRDDGFLVSRYPVPSTLQMHEIYGQPRSGALIKHLQKLQFPAEGCVEGPSSLDGPYFLNAFRRLEHFPITIFIAMPLSEVRAAWWSKVMVPYSLSAMLLIGGFIVYRFALSRQRARELEQWRAHEELHKSEQRYRRLLESLTDAFVVVDTSGKIVEHNRAFSEMLGYSAEELNQLAHRDLSPEKWHALEARVIDEQVLSRGHSEIFEKEYLRRDGVLLPVELRMFLIRNQAGEAEGMWAIIRNVSGRKAAQEELQLFKAIVEKSGQSVAICNPQGLLLYINPAHQKLFGRSLEEARSLNYRDYYPPESVAVLDQVVVPALMEGKGWEGELDVFDASGRRFPLWERADTLFNTSGEALYFFGLMHDLSERKKAEKERLRLEQRLIQAQKAESLSRMAGAVAHNFNNMLGAAIGNLDMALDDAAPGSELHRCLKEAMRASLRAAEISRFMLTYLGQAAGNAKSIDAAKTIGEACALLSASLPENVRLKTSLPSAGPVIKADSSHLTQILGNLLSNAVESLKEPNGEIVVGVDVVAGSEIRAVGLFPPEWTPKSRGYARLSVSDAGSGIEPGIIDQIFDPFYTTKFAGRGLGLSVVLGLARSYGGAVSVESAPDEGATFNVYLPVWEEDAPASV